MGKKTDSLQEIRGQVLRSYIWSTFQLPKPPADCGVVHAEMLGNLFHRVSVLPICFHDSLIAGTLFYATLLGFSFPDF